MSPDIKAAATTRTITKYHFKKKKAIIKETSNDNVPRTVTKRTLLNRLPMGKFNFSAYDL